jgi:phage terminase small subunit
MLKRITTKELTGLKPQYAAFVVEYVKDFAARRAAEASGFSPDSGYQLLERPEIKAAIAGIIEKRLEASHIDAEWVLMEAVDNHQIARQSGNINASNTALNLVAKHVFVDAFAAEKVEVNSDKDVMERLMRGRRRRGENQSNNEPSGDEPSFM